MLGQRWHNVDGPHLQRGPTSAIHSNGGPTSAQRNFARGTNVEPTCLFHGGLTSGQMLLSRHTNVCKMKFKEFIHFYIN